MQNKNTSQYRSSRMDRGTQSTKQQQKLDVKIYVDGGALGTSTQKKKTSLQPSSSRHSSKSEGGSKHSSQPMIRKKPPIIIVPESESALVSLFNARELLQVCCNLPAFRLCACCVHTLVTESTLLEFSAHIACNHKIAVNTCTVLEKIARGRL